MANKTRLSARHDFARAALALAALGALTPLAGCKNDQAGSLSSARTAQVAALNNALVAPTGARAIKVLFKTGGAGSFNPAPAAGTAQGLGVPAVRFFTPGGDVTTQPSWLKSVEVGISGNNNAGATNADCARFAGAGEDGAQCSFSGNAPSNLTSCGAAESLFRVSEYDCSRAQPRKGVGDGNDSVFIRATFDRDTSLLGTGENILAVLEYSSSFLNPTPTDSTACFRNGVLDTTRVGCADFTWKAFLKHTVAETLKPFFMLVPPSFSAVDIGAGTGGGGVATRQILLPLSADGSLSVFQLSRISGLANDANSHGRFTATCTADGVGNAPANSPHCMGMVFYSITFFRI